MAADHRLVPHVGLVLATALGIGLSMSGVASPVLTQASASPVVTALPPPSASPLLGALDIAALLPTQIDGMATQLMVLHGQEHLEGLDPDDPADAHEQAQIERFVQAAGGTLDGLTTASAVALDADQASIVAAARVAGADAGVLRDAYVELLSDAMLAAVAEPGQLEGRDVIVLSDSGVEGGGPFYVYATGDTVWLMAMPSGAAADLLSRLP